MSAPERLVSVVVPVRDQEQYLGEALRSALDQSHPAVEVIVVVDGSTDASAEIARAFEPEVRCVEQPQLGPASARNRGVSLARGELISFLDSDDVFEPTKLERQLDALEGPAAGRAVFGHVAEFLSPEVGDGEAAGLRTPQPPQPARLPSTMLVERSVWEAVGPFDASWRVGELLDWVLRARDLGVGEWMLPDVVLRRRLHPESHTARNASARADYARILKAGLDRRREGTGA